MARRRVVIEISPSRLELAVYSGRSLISTRTDNALTRDLATNWPTSLEKLAGPALSQWVQEAGVVGAPATVLYSSAETASTIHTCPSNAGTVTAVRSALLAMADGSSFSLDQGSIDAQVLHVDAKSTDAAPAAAARQIHSLAVGELDVSATAIHQWVSAAGVRPVSLIPITACTIAAVVREATRDSEGAQSAGGSLILRIGDRESVLIGFRSGRIRFLRTLGIGAESLIDALTNPLQSDGPNPITLSRDQARERLHTVGIPERDQVFEESLAVKGARVLPLLQPVLQRCAIEIKQSLRFGLTEEERASASLLVTGFGSFIPRLSRVLGDLCGVGSRTTSSPVAPSSFPSSAFAGAIRGHEDSPHLRLNLLPKAIVQRSEAARARRNLWIGATAASLLLAYDAATTRLELGEAHARLGALESCEKEYQAASSLREKLESLKKGVAAAEARRLAAMGDVSADWSAVLTAISLSTPRDIRLQSINLATEAAGSVCSITGASLAVPVAAGDNADSGTRLLQDYLGVLAGIPLFGEPSLGATSRALTEDGVSQEFELDIPVINLPLVAVATETRSGPPHPAEGGAP